MISVVVALLLVIYFEFVSPILEETELKFDKFFIHDTHGKKYDPPLRIVIIGDSVDRYMVEDWCGHSITNGNLYSDRCLWDEEFMEKPFCKKLQSFFEAEGIAPGIFPPLKKRFRAWEFRICDALETRGIILSYVFNKCGTGSNGPFWMPVQTLGGIEDKVVESRSVKQTFDISIAPVLRIISNKAILGGSANAVLLHSLFWDLGGFFLNKNPFDHTKLGRQNFKQSWNFNITQLMEVTRNFLPDAKFYGFRTANDFTVNNKEWHNYESYLLLQEMNKEIYKFAGRSGYTVLDKWGICRRRDFLHPSADCLVWFFERSIGTIPIKPKS